MNKTKWDYLTNDQRYALMQTPCGLRCAGCDKMLVSEGDFAAHFIISDSRFLNLGECPDKVRTLSLVR